MQTIFKKSNQSTCVFCNENDTHGSAGEDYRACQVCHKHFADNPTGPNIRELYL